MSVSWSKNYRWLCMDDNLHWSGEIYILRSYGPNGWSADPCSDNWKTSCQWWWWNCLHWYHREKLHIQIKGLSAFWNLSFFDNHCIISFSLKVWFGDCEAETICRSEENMIAVVPDRKLVQPDWDPKISAADKLSVSRVTVKFPTWYSSCRFSTLF